MNAFIKAMKNGIWDQNPTLVLLVGMCPTLAISTSISNAIGMGLSVTAVLICSNLVISLLRKVIPDQIRIAAFVVIIAAFVSAIDMLLQAFLPALSDSLGIYIPLIVVNCIILARAEAFAFKNGPVASALDGLSMGVGFTFALSVMAAIREVLGSGTFHGHDITLGVYQPAMLLVMPAGGFLTLGFLIAAMQKIRSKERGNSK